MTSPDPMPQPPRPAAADAAGAAGAELCLLGSSSLTDFLDFVRERTAGGAQRDRGELADLWRDAAQVYAGLQLSEAGVADKPRVLPLSKALQAHVSQLVELANFQETFSSVPVAFGMVELDTLVASQHHLGTASVDKMLKTVSRPPTDAALAGLCLPLTPAPDGFKLAYDDGRKFVFVSDTHDTRFLGARALKPSQVTDARFNGHPQAVLALGVGFTTNVLNVIRFRDRLVLNNGYHRAWALRAMGVTHAPCLIQVCSHWEDVDLAGSREIYENGELYFSSARPPLLRDFANPGLTRAFPARPLKRQITIKYEVETLQLDV